MKRFDVVVLGAGPGGYSTAGILASNNLKVALIENKHLGGTCINNGCIPTKTLIKSAKVFETIKNSEKFGISVDKIYFDLKKIQQRRVDNKKFFNNSIKNLIENFKLTLFEGYGEVLDKNTIKVSNEIIKFDKLVLATGARPKEINLKGLQESKANGYLIDSDKALELDSIPESLTIIGDGPVSLEFAYFYSTLGSKITILTNMDFLLRFDVDIQKSVKQYFKEKNISVIDNVNIKEIENNKVYYTDKDFVESEKILLAIGRQPNNESFANINIEKDRLGFVKVDKHMKTNFDNIYAIGDITGLFLLSTVAYKTGDIVARNILNFADTERFDKNLIPWSVYLNPEIAGVGLTEQQLTEQNIDFKTIILNSKSLPRAHADGIVSEYSFIKFLVSKETDQILGCFMMIEGASLIINQVALFMQQKLGFAQLQKSAYTHPTIGEGLYYASRAIGIKSK